MKKSIFVLLAIISIAMFSCSKTAPVTPTTPTTGTPCFLVRHFPGIDTITFWYYLNGVRTSDFAQISTTGMLTVTCHATPTRSGSYNIDVVDTTGPGQMYTFYLKNTSSDTVISSSNSVGLRNTQGRQSYYLNIQGGTLPSSQFLGGEYIDSI